MAWSILDENTAGAPSLVSANGSLTSLLRWALPILGWTVEFGPTGNNAVFRGGAGNRLRLHVRHDSSISGNASLAYVRGAHTATSATAVDSPFPTAAQVPNTSSSWRTGKADNSTDPSRFVIAGNNQFFHYFTHKPSYGWEWQFFGLVPTDVPNNYETVIRVRNDTTYYSSTSLGTPGSPNPSYDSKTFWARGINATTVSVHGILDLPSAAVGRVGNTPLMQGGYQNRILREKIAVHDFGSVNTTPGVLCIPKRGWLPNVWNPIHSGLGGAMSDGDTFTDSVYNPAASFRVLDAPSSGTLILETTDTWSKP